jgi:hypothetical protein
VQIVLLLLVGSLTLGLVLQKEDRKVYIGLGLLIGFAIIAYLYFRRFL